MAVTEGITPILEAARTWRDRCLRAGGSVFAEEPLWTSERLEELNRHFVENLETGTGNFLEKLQTQLGPVSPAGKRLAAEMLWVLVLFPNNLSQANKRGLTRTVWAWSGEELAEDHPLLGEPLARGVGSGGMGFNSYRWAELVFFILLMRDWRARSREEQEHLLAGPWEFGTWLDTIPGAQNRQFRHMLLYLLFPEHYERISSSSHKTRIEEAFLPVLGGGGEQGTSYLARDKRLLQIRRALEQANPGETLDFYAPPLVERWDTPENAGDPTEVDDPDGPRPDPPAPYVEPEFPEILARVRAQGLRISEQALRRYHLALRARGFVILSGVSGTGKTWLAEAYARAVGAEHLIVPVAPNWTTNEDLLGYTNPLDGAYHDTAFSRFLRRAAAEHARARAEGEPARPFHLVLDEMNLARVEYYFARFLSVMEVRARHGTARVELGPKDEVVLPPTLRFVGTVNVDETTHGFADKVYDRAQLIEMEASREAMAEHVGDAPYADVLLDLWDAVAGVAPFAFRVADEIGHYLGSAQGTGAGPDELLDEQILQKVLPKLKGSDLAVGEALGRLEELTAGRYPLSHGKVVRMREGFQQHGFASYF